MSKFKVGDKVIGNDKANHYRYTKEGHIGTVLKADGDWIVISHKKARPSGFIVSSEDFNLYTGPDIEGPDIELQKLVDTANAGLAAYTELYSKYSDKVQISSVVSDGFVDCLPDRPLLHKNRIIRIKQPEK